MIIKSADDRSRDLAELEATLAIASGQRKAQLERELRNIRAGLKAEQEAAYLIDFHLRASSITGVIHDLRLDIGGRVAQIDHLLIHRTLNVFVLETKHFHSGLKVTEDGEFLRWNDYRRTYEGMASPFAQNERHIAVLKDAFKRIDMPTRMGFRLSPTFVSFVIVSPNARVDRPKRFDTSRIIKADMVLKALEAKLDNEGVLESIAGISRFVSGETVMDISRKLVALHTPAARRTSGQPSPDRTVSSAEAPDVAHENRNQAIAKRPVGANSADRSCRTCGGTELTILHGKYGYYFKCRTCSGNTPIKLDCGTASHRERLRKDGIHFYRECADCRTSELFHSNPD